MDPSEHLRRRAELQAKLRTPRFIAAQAAWKRIRGNFFALERAGAMRYVKVLGHGGFGLVQLWELYNPDGTLRREVAVKGLVNPALPASLPAQRNEVYWAKAFAGCEHMIQLVDLDPAAMQSLDINNDQEPEPPGPLLANRPFDPLMVSEYSELGSLRALMALLQHSKQMNPLLLSSEEPGLEYIPTRVLWSMFCCMIRAVVAMAYPPKDPKANKKSGTVVREKIPEPDEDRKPRRIIHFDIDLANIFVGAATESRNPDDEHYACPTTKIADYGLMAEWDDEWSEDQKATACRYGKYGYRAPEVKDMDFARQPGLMSYHANIYQIGATMQELILQRTLAPDEVTAEERTVQVPSGRNFRYQTYGWRMMAADFGDIYDDYKKVDMNLRSLVMACMAADPRHRPRLEFLLKHCEEKMQVLAEEATAAATAASGRPTRPTVTPFQAKFRMDPEPVYLTEKFYDEYFLNPLEHADEFSGFWSRPVR